MDASLLLGREVIDQDGPLLTLLAPIPHHDARAIDDFPGVAFAVEHACCFPRTAISLDAPIFPSRSQETAGRPLTQAGPLPQHFPVGHLDQRDPVLPAQRHHQLLVGLLLAPFVQHAHVRLAPVERFGGFAEAAGEAVVDEGELQGAFEGFEGGLRGWVWGLVFGGFLSGRDWRWVVGT